MQNDLYPLSLSFDSIESFINNAFNLTLKVYTWN